MTKTRGLLISINIDKGLAQSIYLKEDFMCDLNEKDLNVIWQGEHNRPVLRSVCLIENAGCLGS